MSIDYTILYKEVLPIDGEWISDNYWDIFISAYNLSERVKKVFNKVKCGEKLWIIFPEYEFGCLSLPGNEGYYLLRNDEAEFIKTFFDDNKIELTGKKICIDMTGFIRPYLMFLIRWLHHKGLKRIDVLYSEPDYYRNKEETRFSDEVVTQVRQVEGFKGVHSPDNSNDLLIIGAGYDNKLIAQVANNKKSASKKYQLYGLPSLQADFYQENVLKADKAKEEVGSRAGNDPNNYLAPANDPFVTANILK